MNVSELVSVLDWIESEVREAGLPAAYGNLGAILKQNAQGSQPAAPFAEQKAALLYLLRQIPLHTLTLAQVRFLDSLAVGELLGESAAKHIEEVLYTNALDTATAAAEVAKSTQELNQGLARAAELRKALKGLTEERADELGDEVLIRLGFEGQAEIGNIVDLKSWATKWHEIGRGLAMFHDSAPESVRIVGAGRGSVVLDLAVAYGIAQTVALVILKSLEAAERVQTIRLKAEEIRGLRLSNKKLAQEIQKEADVEKGKSIDAIVSEVKAGSPANMDGERTTALEKSVKGLVDFLEKGGEVDCLIPAEDESGDEGESRTQGIRKLTESFEQIRKLEARMRLLAPPADS